MNRPKYFKGQIVMRTLEWGPGAGPSRGPNVYVRYAECVRGHCLHTAPEWTCNEYYIRPLTKAEFLALGHRGC